MQSVSFKHKVGSMEADMANMATWRQKFQDNANRQGALDCRYASERYSKGIRKAEDFMDRKHKVILQESFASSHAEIAAFAHAINSGDRQPLLDLTRRVMKS